MINFQQSVNIREILLCSTLSERAVKIEFKQQQGSHLQRLLRLLQILQTGCKVEVKPQSLIYIPGILTNRDGEPIKFDCGDRSISYFLEIILILSLYAKAELNLELEGVTNDSNDCSVDTIINAFIPLVKRFAPEWICQVKVNRRGYGGKGLVLIKSQPIKYLKSVEQLERGPIKRIRGVCSGSKIAPNLLNRLVSQARNIFNDYIPDVWIHTDIQKSVKGIDFESGYGVSLVAETIDGVFISTDCEFSPDGAKDPEQVGERAALQLLDEIQYSGCVDTSLQQYAFLLMALSEKKLNQFNIGRISIQTVETLRIIKQMLGVTFAIEGNIFSCLGTGLQNLSRMTQ